MTFRYIKQTSTGKTITDSSGDHAWSIESETVTNDRMLADCAAATGFDISDLEIASDPDLSNVHKMPAPVDTTVEDKAAANRAFLQVLADAVKEHGTIEAALASLGD